MHSAPSIVWVVNISSDILGVRTFITNLYQSVCRYYCIVHVCICVYVCERECMCVWFFVLKIIFYQATRITRQSCVAGCGISADVITSPLSPSLPTPLFPPGLTEASTALERDPGIYRVNYDLADQKSQAATDITSNFTTFIFQVQNCTRSHYYFKVRGNHYINFINGDGYIAGDWMVMALGVACLKFENNLESKFLQRDIILVIHSVHREL